MAINIEQIISDASERAQDLSRKAESVIVGMTRYAQPVLPSPPGAVLVPSLTLPAIPPAPKLMAVPVQKLGALPVQPSVVQIVASFPSAPPAFNKDAPEFVEPIRPGEVQSFTKMAPAFTTPAIPSAPSAALPAEPILSDVSLPSPISVEKQKFQGVAPNEVPEPDDFSNGFKNSVDSANSKYSRDIEAAYLSLTDRLFPGARLQFKSLRERIDSDLQAGGTGINVDVERKIIERAKTVTTSEFNRASKDAVKAMAARGFTMPNGVIQATINQARNAGMDAYAKAANDLAIAQIELEQKQNNFLLGLSVDIAKTIQSLGLSYYQQLAGIGDLALRYASQLVDVAIKAYDVEVKSFTLKLEQYKTDASVFEVLIRASMNEVEIYKAQIDGARAQVQVDEARVRVYQAQVDAHKTAMDVYSANIRAIVDVANLEKIKLDVFQTEVQAYAASVNANSAQWNAYSAVLQGNEAKVRAHMADVQAHSATVSAYKAGVDAESSRISAIGESNKAELGVYEARVRAFGAQAQANASVVSSHTEVNRSLLSAYQVENQAVIASAGAAAEQYRATASVEIEKAKMINAYNMAYAQAYNEFIRGQASQSIEVSKVYAGMAQSALGGVNALAVGEQA